MIVYLDASIFDTGMHGEQHLSKLVVPRGAGQRQERFALLGGLVYGAALRQELTHCAYVAVRARLCQRRRTVCAYGCRRHRRRARCRRAALLTKIYKRIVKILMQTTTTVTMLKK